MTSSPWFCVICMKYTSTKSLVQVENRLVQNRLVENRLVQNHVTRLVSSSVNFICNVNMEVTLPLRKIP